MRERGFMPFSAAGALIVLLVIGMIGHAAWSRHERSMSTADDVSASALMNMSSSVQADIRDAARFSIYRALWDVCKHADEYDDNARERAIERLAADYFLGRLAEIGLAYARHDTRIELDLPESARPGIELEGAGGGYALAHVNHLGGARLRLASRDGSLSIALPLENVDIFIDSRYFLLQERMGEFYEKRDGICASWQAMEYISAWAGAWLRGNVELSSSRTRAFFETSWAIHELDVFGSSDYWATARGLIDAAGAGGASTLLTELSDPTVLVTPIRATDVEEMIEHIDLALGSVETASALVSEARELVRRVHDMTGPPENVIVMLNEAGARLTGAEREISGAGGHFNQLIDFIASSAPNNAVMATLYQSLTSRMIDGGYPSLKEQMDWCVEGTMTKISELKGDIGDVSAGGFEDLLARAESLTEELLSQPTPKRWVTLTTYSGDPPRPVEERVPVYIDCEVDGTVGLLKLILMGARSNLEEMGRLSQQYEPALEEMEIDEELTSKLIESPPEFSIDREGFYELLPPAPIQASPGLSVFHQFEMKNVSYHRRDLAGIFGSPTATPIPLWFIGVTLWWGQWETTLELEPGPVEEVFDFDNPTLPLPHGTGYFHKPLAYRWGMPERPYGVNVIVISLRPFTISTR